ncbi:replication-relaxation family protein [Streptomyces sp. NPDC052095]|uniref:replication-relaxation family protein n=1 Tax=unclassified Streptomyces TaxID=2593676 RepID=UPI00344B5D09
MRLLRRWSVCAGGWSRRYSWSGSCAVGGGAGIYATSPGGWETPLRKPWRSGGGGRWFRSWRRSWGRCARAGCGWRWPIWCAGWIPGSGAGGSGCDPKAAASQLQEHTLAVVGSGIAFTEWASRLGDECGALDWEPELAHRVREGDSRLGDDAFLVPDAVLRYTRTAGDRRQLLTFFLEIDRSTMQVARLGQKLDTYARYASYVPQPLGRRRPVSTREAWRERYPVFPSLLIILSGASEHVLRRRTEDLRALASANPRVAEAGRLRVGVTTAELLDSYGPFAPIVMPVLGDAERTDVLLAAHSEPGMITSTGVPRQCR